MPDLTPEIIANTVRAAQKAKAHELALATDPLSVLEQAVRIGLTTDPDTGYGVLTITGLDAYAAAVRAHAIAECVAVVEAQPTAVWHSALYDYCHKPTALAAIRALRGGK